MKKILSLAGIMVTAAILSTSAFAVNNDAGNSTDSTNQQEFYDKTAPLRASLAADRAELNALMMGDNPDVKRIRALSESLSKSQDELRRLAGNYNPSMFGHGGTYMGMNCGQGGQGPHHMSGQMNGHVSEHPNVNEHMM